MSPNFTNQLAVMIKAGISIRAALDAIAEQTENPKFKEILTQIKKDVESGKSFSDALSRYPRTFCPLYINMVKASELSGSFGQMLERIVEYLNAQLETRQMVVGAMVYPCIIFVMAVGTTMFLLLFVVPQFVAIFKGNENILPAAHQDSPVPLRHSCGPTGICSSSAPSAASGASSP